MVPTVTQNGRRPDGCVCKQSTSLRLIFISTTVFGAALHCGGVSLTGGVAAEVAAAHAQALAPQLEARLGHALPLGAHLVGGGREGVVAGVAARGPAFAD